MKLLLTGGFVHLVIGSTNPTKIAALSNVLLEYEEFCDCTVHSCSVASGVPDQPKTLEEIISGAQNRARAAFVSADLSVGLESGLFSVPYTKTGMLVTTACVIYDGTDFHLGLSSAFECPEKVIALVRESKLDLNRAFHLSGLTDNPKLGHEGGAIGVLTKGHVTRAQYMMQAIRVALIHIQNKELY